MRGVESPNLTATEVAPFAGSVATGKPTVDTFLLHHLLHHLIQSVSNTLGFTVHASVARAIARAQARLGISDMRVINYAKESDI